ncbi:potassium transporter Kup [Chitinivorax sp. B]|uniref:potassium transporter Kup n=1 Tax=Chitinivorax sp. B TaxID=2502235 RepID=UPI0010F781BF|nr:potassium transporter Kup [Chitinivorax sp. B]
MQLGAQKGSLAGLIVGAIGVVYGDIGTSPLYTMKECFTGPHALSPTPSNILGVLSLIFWSLLIIVSLKYVVFIMRADNQGEGGSMALMALAQRCLRDDQSRGRWLLMLAGIFGTSLFFGDGMITPAISVLSAVEGLGVIAPALHSYVIPVTLTVLVFLFTVQRYGTASVGKAFGPIMVVWFLSLGSMGLASILRAPDVLTALNPFFAISFFTEHPWHSFVTLGAVVLALTGAEALYADMGHFGKSAIRRAWFCFVLPALLLNYFGQGALLIHNPEAVQSPFYLLAPKWAQVPLLILATAATVIASQAVISGAFSLTRQAVQLGYLPRLEILHTSEREIGQIYIPAINWLLFSIVICLVLGFKTSSNLAAAYGMTACGMMVITTCMAFIVARRVWGWSKPALFLAFSSLLIVDLTFFASNALKFFQGGWFPFSMGLILFTLLTTWKRGRQILAERLSADALPLDSFVEAIEAHPPTRVQGTAVFMTSSQEGVPHALLHNLKHNKVLHERVVLVTIATEDIPYVPDIDRIQIQQIGETFYTVQAAYGFKEEPNIDEIMDQCGKQQLTFDMMDTSFFLSRETLIPSEMPGMALWREKVFTIMSRNALRATDFFKIPTNRVVELGTQVEI